MKKIKVLVVEDEIIIADNICRMLSELNYEALEPAISYSEALESVTKNNPDLAILDIRLSGSKSGLDLAEKLRDDYNIPFIFLTSNSDEATIQRAKELRPASYLLKPFRKEDIYTTLEVVVNNQLKTKQEEANTAERYLFLKDGYQRVKVLLDDVIYVKSDHVYVEIYTSKKKHISRISLSEIQEKLSGDFQRIHRSFVVNCSKIESVTSKSVTVEGVEIPLSKTYKNELSQRLKL